MADGSNSSAGPRRVLSVTVGRLLKCSTVVEPEARPDSPEELLVF
jgi:hypothetical protein